MQPLIYGIDNHDAYSFITVQKISKLQTWISTVLKAANIPVETGEESADKWIHTHEEVHWSYYDDEKDDLAIDLFIATKKCFIVISGSKSKRQRILQQMCTHGTFAKPKTFKK